MAGSSEKVVSNDPKNIKTSQPAHIVDLAVGATSTVGRAVPHLPIDTSADEVRNGGAIPESMEGYCDGNIWRPVHVPMIRIGTETPLFFV